MNTYVLEIDGYQFGDRLLEGVTFEVPLVEEAGEWKVLREVRPSDSAFPYISRIKWEGFAPAMINYVAASLQETLKYCENEGISFQNFMDDFSTETGLHGIQVLCEY